MPEKQYKPGFQVSEIFNKIIKDLKSDKVNDFKGAIDIAIEFNSVTIHKDGSLISLFSGNEQTKKNTSIKLATRVYIE